MEYCVIRLRKGQDLKKSLLSFCIENGIEAACVVSSVGCLYQANIRLAKAMEYKEFDEDLEIISVNGTINQDACHLHISFADQNGSVFGGHLCEGCLVNTTCEIVLLVLKKYVFQREFDQETGYNELVIMKK